MAAAPAVRSRLPAVRVLGVDIGAHNTALALLKFSAPSVVRCVRLAMHGDCDTTEDVVAKTPYAVQALENLALGGGTSTDVCAALCARLSSPPWIGHLRAADAVIVELQNGNRSPLNLAIQAMVQSFAFAVRGHQRNVIVQNNAAKLHTMALYGLIRDRGEQTAPAADGSTRKRATHHFNKDDVVRWFRDGNGDSAAVDAAATRAGNPAKVDDLVDAITHALVWVWHQRESRALRRTLKRRGGAVRLERAPPSDAAPTDE